MFGVPSQTGVIPHLHERAWINVQKGQHARVKNSVTDRYCKNVKLQLEIHKDKVTRGHTLKLVNSICHYDLRNYSFAVRVVNIWNILPDSVISANKVNTFKNRLASIRLENDLYCVRLGVKLDQLLDHSLSLTHSGPTKIWFLITWAP